MILSTSGNHDVPGVECSPPQQAAVARTAPAADPEPGRWPVPERPYRHRGRLAWRSPRSRSRLVTRGPAQMVGCAEFGTPARLRPLARPPLSAGLWTAMRNETQAPLDSV